jgi:hypothetical protein
MVVVHASWQTAFVAVAWRKPLVKAGVPPGGRNSGVPVEHDVYRRV